MTNIHPLEFKVESSLRYHMYRRGHYEKYHKVMMFLLVILAMATFMLSASPYPFLAAFAGFLLMLAATLSAAWNPMEKFAIHDRLVRRFSDVTTKVKASPDDMVVRREVMEIECDEPYYRFRALEASCANEVRQAWGIYDENLDISFWSMLTRNWLMQENTKFEEIHNR